MGVPELLGTSVGMLIANPFVWIAGIVVSRTPLSKIRLWVELVIAAVVCTALQIGLDSLEDLPSFPLSYWFIALSLATVSTTIICRLLRKLRLVLFISRREDVTD